MTSLQLRLPIMTIATSITSLALTAPAQAQTVVEISSGEYWSSNGLRADVIWGSSDPFQGVFLWPDNASPSQEFEILDNGNGYFRIKARHSGQCLMLDWRGASFANGTPVIQYPYCDTGYAPSEWSISWIWKPSPPCPSGMCFDTSAWYRRIVNRATGKCLDAANPSGGMPGAQVTLAQWDCISSPSQWNAWNQMWTFRSATSQTPPPPPPH
jgi:Ricin-type beta-trefoil lectin domain-like